MNVVSSLLMVIWESCSRGRTGPVNRRSVGRLWPNRSTCPGPDGLRSGALAPTWITCPATVTVCIGVTSSATAIAAAASTTSNTSPVSHRSAGRAHRRAVARVSELDRGVRIAVHGELDPSLPGPAHVLGRKVEPVRGAVDLQGRAGAGARGEQLVQIDVHRPAAADDPGQGVADDVDVRVLAGPDEPARHLLPGLAEVRVHRGHADIEPGQE